MSENAKNETGISPLFNELKIIGFAALVCVVCSMLLATTSSALRERQQINIENDRKLNVLKTFGVDIRPHGKKLNNEQIRQYFKNFLREIFIDLDGNVLEGKTRMDFKPDDIDNKNVSPLPLYVWSEKGNDTMYAIRMYGMGLWSTIYSYLALKEDLATIKGVTFYGHAETPGLGGECSEDWFQNNFTNKVLWTEGNPVEFKVVKGKVSDKYPHGNPSAVDGITGATLTGMGIQNFINEDYKKYNAYFNKIRK